MRKTAKQWKDIYSSQEFKEKYVCEGASLGALVTQKGTSFRLWSPFADAVTLNLYRQGSGAEAFEKHCMIKGEKGIWEYRTKRNLHKIYYDFTLQMEGRTVFSADPYARACGINGQRSMAVDLGKTDPEGWQEDRPPALEQETVIYELHVKEFSWDRSGGFPEETRGKYTAFLHTDTTLDGDGVHPTGISYLKELGVNYIQLMPVYDYGSVDETGKGADFNWGYDPVNYNVPEGSYSTDPSRGEVRIRELKEMIQSLHAQGFRIIMDVVYNHTYSLDSWFQRTVPWYFYRVNEDGTASNGSACGNDVASEREMCAKYILESVLYWAQEYHMDGFRFDLMGLLDVDLMNRIRAALDERYGKGEKILFGEPWAADRTAMEQEKEQALKQNIHNLDKNTGMFCDNTRDAIKGSALELKEPGFVNGAPGMETDILNSVRAWCGGDGPSGAKAPSQIITYVSSHDNQTLWDKLSETTTDEELRKREYRLAAGIYMTCQGRLFLLSGEEFARSKDGMEDSYNAPIEINRLDWRKAWRERELVDYYRGLIALRKRLPGLCDKSREAWRRIYGQWTRDGVVGFFVDNQPGAGRQRAAWDTVQVIYNSRKEREDCQLPAGDWEVLADGQDSFRWEKPEPARGEIAVEPVSMVILGRREQEK